MGTLTGLTLGLAVGVAAVAYVAIVRGTGTSPRELAWTLIPAALLAGLFAWSVAFR